jgi:hypothetical protein
VLSGYCEVKRLKPWDGTLEEKQNIVATVLLLRMMEENCKLFSGIEAPLRTKKLQTIFKLKILCQN